MEDFSSITAVFHGCNRNCNWRLISICVRLSGIEPFPIYIKYQIYHNQLMSYRQITFGQFVLNFYAQCEV